MYSAFSTPTSPIWQDSSTSIECLELEKSVGGSNELAQLTGSKAYERFTGSQIRKLYKNEPSVYQKTKRISLVSSFGASLLVGSIAPSKTRLTRS